MKGIKQGESWKVWNEAFIFDGVLKCHKWVENANQDQLKPIIWYTSWFFSRGGGKKIPGGKKNFVSLRPSNSKILPPYRILIYVPE